MYIFIYIYIYVYIYIYINIYPPTLSGRSACWSLSVYLLPEVPHIGNHHGIKCLPGMGSWGGLLLLDSDGAPYQQLTLTGLTNWLSQGPAQPRDVGLNGEYSWQGLRFLPGPGRPPNTRCHPPPASRAGPGITCAWGSRVVRQYQLRQHLPGCAQRFPPGRGQLVVPVSRVTLT